MYVVFEVFGDQKVERDLLRLSDRAVAPTPALEAIIKDFGDIADQEFESEGGRAGGWAPLKEETLAAKARKGMEEGILRETNRLYNSLVGVTEDTIWETGANTLRWGSRVPYGGFHQTGTRNMPARPFRLSEIDRQGAVRTIQRYLLGEGAVNAETFV